MKRHQVILSYALSFLVLVADVVFLVRYLVNILENTRVNYRSETIYLTQGDSLQNFYSAVIPEVPPRGMLVLNSVALSSEGYRFAAEKGLIVVSVANGHFTLEADSLLSFRKIVSAAARRYHVSEDRIMIGDFSAGDTAYVTCKKARNRFAAEPFNDMENLSHQATRNVVDESGLISWAASVLAKEKD